jgi:hypothetical protein
VAKKRMTCLACGLTLRRKACPVHGKAGMAPASAVKATLSANAAVVKAAAGRSFLAKSAAPRPRMQTAEEARRETLMRDLYRSPDPAMREGLWRAAHPEFQGNGGRPA